MSGKTLGEGDPDTPSPPGSSCAASTGKAKETGKLGQTATDGIFICFKSFLLGEPYEMCILFPEKSPGTQLPCSFLPELFGAAQTI